MIMRYRSNYGANKKLLDLYNFKAYNLPLLYQSDY